MRITYRGQGNKAYWEKRWAACDVDDAMENADAYPLKYAEMTVRSKEGRILEAGCGTGRLLRYYASRGHKITGIDFVESAVTRIKHADPSLDVHVADITKLPFDDASFRYVLAFGLYHNLETGLETALRETARVLEKNGLLCASFRADNFHTRLSDWLEEHRARRHHRAVSGEKKFHKRSFARRECVTLLEAAGFDVQNVYEASNMPIFYKFSWLRAKDHKAFDEHRGRKEGYRLSPFAERLAGGLMKLWPTQFCNLYVVIARKQ